MNQNNRKP